MFEHRRIIKDILEHYGIDITYYLALELLHIEDAKNWLVKKEYHRLYKTGDYSYSQVKDILTERYSISRSSIEKMIYKDHKV